MRGLRPPTAEERQEGEDFEAEIKREDEEIERELREEGWLSEERE